MVSRIPKLSKCRCGQHLLVGLDGDRCALVARVDIYPLSNVGEVEAMRDGRRTYRLYWRTLDPRDQWNIAGMPAEAGTVLAEHRCGAPIPADWRRPIHVADTRRTADADF